MYVPSEAYERARKGDLTTKFIIDMDSPWQRLSNGADQSPHAHAPGRLTSESVNVDLRTPPKLVGKTGKPTPTIIRQGWRH